MSKCMMWTSNILFRAGITTAIMFLGVGQQAYAQAAKPPTLAPGVQPESPRPAVDGEPNSTSASFGDWVMRCQRLGTGAETLRTCEVAQQIHAQEQQSPVAELAIGRIKKSDPMRLTFVLPVNITFSNPPSFSASGEQQEPLDLGWRKCLPGGCFADAPLKDDMLQRWKKLTNGGRIIWKDASGRDLAVTLSFRGLAQALDAMGKEP